MSIKTNLLKIKEEVERINPQCEIVPATKTRTISEIFEAYTTGIITAVGENRVQELLQKYDDTLKWDFIGRLQSNKVKYIVDKVRLIHSVDRLSLAEEIEKESAKRDLITNILIEINGDKENNKGGIYLENTEGFLEKLSVFPHIKPCGMMVVTQKNATQADDRKTFDKIFAVYDRLKNENFKYLSMGMSNNYLIALEAGSNLIRPGRAIFSESVDDGIKRNGDIASE